MSRDSLFDETILWTGRPKALTVPPVYKLIVGVSVVLAVVSLAFALVVGTALRVPVGGLLSFSAWCATIALGAWRLPLVWRSGVSYIVTDKHVIWRRGRIRRSIDRAAISYAIIRWSSRVAGAGDLILVRAVPTGALRRTLSLTLSDVDAPDRLWSTVRGVAPTAPLGDGHRPLAQRLDEGERVLWSAIPLASAWNARRAVTALVAVVLSAASVRMVVHAVPTIRRVLRMHALPPVTFGILVAAVALAASLLIAVAVGVAYFASIRPLRLARATRYFVTNRRVLIQRGSEELHLDRSRIAYVIAAPSRGLHDLFLVLDGPQARALSASGAFGGDDGGKLLPVFSAIDDAETVGAILHTPRPAEVLRDAA